MDSCDDLVLFASQRKSHARLSLFLLECNVEQLLHKILWPDVSPLLFLLLLLFSGFFFYRGGSVCLSWLLEPSLSIKRKPIFCCLFWSVWSVEWFAGTATPKRCVLLYINHQAFCLYQLFLFVPFLWGGGGGCFIVLDWLIFLFSDCFLEIKFCGKSICVNVQVVDLIVFPPLLIHFILQIVLLTG